MTSSLGAFVLLDVGGTSCALPVPSIHEIMFFAELFRVPTMPPVMAGMLNYGGVPVPVLRIARLLGLEDKAPGVYTPLVIVRHTGGHLGLLVDAVRAVVQGVSILAIPPGHCFQDLSTSSITWREKPISVLNLDRLLIQQETRCVASFRELERERLEELAEVTA